jgi:hypothetical protein
MAVFSFRILIKIQKLQESRKVISSAHVQVGKSFFGLLLIIHYSSLSWLQRVMAWHRRFIMNCRIVP